MYSNIQLNVDKILTSLEQCFGEVKEDGSNCYLLCNLNAIQTACLLLNLLDKIEKRYSMAKLRTSGLYEVILTQARSVLDCLFFP